MCQMREPFHVERVNGGRKMWCIRQTPEHVQTVLESELAATLTPELVQELRHTQRKPVSGKKPLRRLLSIPLLEGITHIRSTVTSSFRFLFQS